MVTAPHCHKTLVNSEKKQHTQRMLFLEIETKAGEGMSVELTDQVIEVFKTVCQMEHIKLPPQMSGITSLRDLGLNSLLFIKIVVRLEVEFDVDFEDESMDIGAFVVVDDIVKYIENQQN